MRTLPLAGVFAALLFFVVFTAYGQETTDHVVINEIDTNPANDDAKSVSEWVELYNPTNEDVDISGWKIASTTVTKKTLTLPVGTTIKPGQFLIYSYTRLWFTDVSEKVQLKDKEGNLVDETPAMTDQKNDFSSWQRKFDGADSNASNDWIFRMSSAGSSNGKLGAASGSSDGAVIIVETDKRNYIFGETAIITGNISKRVYQEKPYYTQAQITIHVDGPGSYDKKFTIYPDMKLQFKAQLKLDKVQGVDAGNYVVSADYADSDDTALFIVGDEVTFTEAEQESELVISTDATSYLPGQRVTISASTTKIIPLAGLDYAVYDPKVKQLFSGKLFPSKSGEFSGKIPMTTVNPVFGKFDIIADYGKQHAETTFELTSNIKDTEKIVLSTDKKAYGLGESITISGRSNKHVVALDLEVLQTGVTAIGKDTNNVFKIKDQVKLAGDSTFSYDLKIPSDQLRLGDYRVTVSKEFGMSIIYFKIVEDPDTYVSTGDGNYVSTDKPDYASGEKMSIIGHVIPKTRSSSFDVTPVKVSITDESGKDLSIVGKDKKLRVRDESIVTTYSFTAIPDDVGNYKIDTVLNQATFTPGAYKIKAAYGSTETSTMFTVSSATDTANKKIVASTDKTVYGLGEKVTLDGTLLTGQSAIKITLTKPDGKTVNSGAKIDDSKFSWSWEIPKKDYDLADIRDPKEARPSVFGNYKISVIATSETTDVFFKVSKNPATDKLEVKPLDVKTEKQVYSAGEKLKIIGEAIKRQQTTSTSGGEIQDRVNVVIKSWNNKPIYESNLSFDSAGHFGATYDLPLTIFKDASYKVTAIYQGLRADTTFEVRNKVPTADTSKLAITLNTDKGEYSPGETIQIFGNTNKVVLLGKLDLVVIPEESTEVSCGTSYCGLGGKKIDLTRYYDNGSYTYDYVLPANVALGSYIIKADTEFGTFTATFKVVEKKAEVKATIKISEKFNRITEALVEIPIFEQTLEDQDVVPILWQGSVVTPKGSEKDVNLKITSEEGQCVIGQDADCLISKSTKSADASYEIVTIGAYNYKVTYSGHTPLLEKFSISPESEGNAIPDSVWTVEIVKEENKSSRFYYEIVYNPLQ
ncbi:MAG: lamin tail domain-containing protein [Nitrososphaerota archaeon]